MEAVRAVPYVDGRIEAVSARRRRRSRVRRPSRARAFVLGCAVMGLVVTGAFVALAVVFVDDPTALVSCDLASLHARSLGQNTFVSAAGGARLGAVPSTWNREPVPLRRISPWLPRATVAIEDTR